MYLFETSENKEIKWEPRDKFTRLELKRSFEPPTYRYPHAISCLKDLEPVAIPGYARSPFYVILEKEYIKFIF
jgi:hypothetical protein